MVPEEIKKLSETYAEYMCPVGDYCGGVYDDQRNSDLPIYKDDAKQVLKWLSERFCIIPKEKIKEEYKQKKDFLDHHTFGDDYLEGKIDELIELFGSQLLEGE